MTLTMLFLVNFAILIFCTVVIYIFNRVNASEPTSQQEKETKTDNKQPKPESDFVRTFLTTIIVCFVLGITLYLFGVDEHKINITVGFILGGGFFASLASEK